MEGQGEGDIADMSKECTSSITALNDNSTVPPWSIVMEMAPCTKAHLATQRAHLDPKVFTDNEVQMGQTVKIKTATKEYLCTLWPGRRKTFCVDKLVEKDEACALDRNHACQILPLCTSTFAQVMVKVVLMVPGVDTFSLNPRNELLHAVVKNALLGKCVAEGYCLNAGMLDYGKLVGIDKIVITQTSLSTTVGTVAESTAVTISQVESQSKLEQKERFRFLKLGGVQKELNEVVARVKISQLKNVFSRDSKDQLKLVKSLYLKCNFLIRGPPGNGKTEFVKIVARESNAYLHLVTPSICSGSRLGEMGGKLKKLLKDVEKLACEGLCLVLFDDIDVFCPREKQSRQGSVQQERTLALFTNALDEVSDSETSCMQFVVSTVSSND